MSELWTSLQPTLSTGGSVIVLSTPNGVGNWYHQTFINAEENKNTFYPITLHWSMHPERDQTWRDEQDIELGYRKAKQECDASFLSSGETVIPGEILEYYRLNRTGLPINTTGIDNNVWIWKFPEENKKYIVSSDVARGDGKDYSTFQVLELETLEQVAEYQGKIGTTVFAHLLIEYATKYNDAVLAIENTGIGWSVIQEVINRNYKNLFYTDSSISYIDYTVENKYAKNINSNSKLVPGFTMSTKTRPLVVSKLEKYLSENSIDIKSKRLINELTTFIWRNGRPEAAPNYNDDLVIAYSIGLWIRDIALKLFQSTIESKKTTLSLFKVETNNIPTIKQYTDLNIRNTRYVKVGNQVIDLVSLM